MYGYGPEFNDWLVVWALFLGAVAAMSGTAVMYARCVKIRRQVASLAQGVLLDRMRIDEWFASK